MTKREIDALIAEKITRHECDNCGSMADCGCQVTNIGSGLPRYSTDPAASKQLRDKMRANGWSYSVEWSREEKTGNTSNYCVSFDRARGVILLAVAGADTEEMAVALAALKAVGVKL